jgi:NAD(P)-dependent dehydrogenase (short-subunit alcohol dehydrogenase family)
MASAPRRALVTGGASGFGLEIARRLVSAGARVALLDNAAARLAKATESLGRAAIGLVADVRSVDAVREATSQAAERLGGLDTLVVAAGIIRIQPLEDITEDDWDAVLDVNLKGAFIAVQAAAPHLRKSGRGRVVALSSDAGRRGCELIQAYTASKFGLVGLMESLAVELAPDGITVNTLCPVGCPTTPMGEQVLQWKMVRTRMDAEAIQSATAKGNPVGRNARESDIASAAMFFLSEEASFITGVALDIDGGAHLGRLPGVA